MIKQSETHIVKTNKKPAGSVKYYKGSQESAIEAAVRYSAFTNSPCYIMASSAGFVIGGVEPKGLQKYEIYLRITAEYSNKEYTVTCDTIEVDKWNA